ncbi:DUF4258 domain-containing protein [Thermococcus sp.]|uniref:DUF4258 domain-containing protein n=1 Tax=Thermococcus sp. TaxID=35749 RepID=UPI00262E4F5A|nr:DUF4258 domain-containing protein [Thermococcus sp.]
MANIILSEHAKLRLKERKIEIDEVHNVMEFPEMKFYDLKSGHFIAIGRRGVPNHWLIIAYDDYGDVIEVITIIDTSKSLEKIVEKRTSSRRWIQV